MIVTIRLSVRMAGLAFLYNFVLEAADFDSASKKKMVAENPALPAGRQSKCYGFTQVFYTLVAC